MTTTGLERLNTWVKAKEFALKIYSQILPLLPAEEKFILGSQIRRAATSIPANIAEGYGRFYYQSNIQFCYNARGSLEELLSHLILSHDLGYLPNEVFAAITAEGNNLVILINGYIAYLKKSKQGENELGNQGMIKENNEVYKIEDDDIDQ
jgi:four helix bundle protein